jgi:hypothetical protein
LFNTSEKPGPPNSPNACSYWRCTRGAKRSGNELSALLVNGTPARTCGKWPILQKAASLLSGNLTRAPGPDLLVGPFSALPEHASDTMRRCLVLRPSVRNGLGRLHRGVNSAPIRSQDLGLV